MQRASYLLLAIDSIHAIARFEELYHASLTGGTLSRGLAVNSTVSLEKNSLTAGHEELAWAPDRPAVPIFSSA
jgi:hypothetical protein